MKLIKVLFAIVVLIVVIAVIAGVSLVMFMDPNKLKPVIAEEVQKRTGYQIMLDGTLSWSFYPRLGVKISHLALRSAGQAAPFVDLTNLTIATEFMQLITGTEKLNGEIYIADVKLMNMKAKNVRIKLGWQNNELTMQPMTADLYAGTMDGAVHASNFMATPKWDWDINLKQIQVRPLLTDLNGSNGKLNLSGVADVKMKAYTQGNTKEAMMSNMNGSLAYSLNNGVLEGIDINYLLQTADALLNKGHTQSPANINQTQFDRVDGSAVISNGVFDTSNTTLTSNAFTAKAKGTLNLINQMINFQLRIQSQQMLKTQWEIPVLITGSVDRPDVTLDTVEIEKFIATKEVDNVKSKVRQEIKNRVPGKAGEFLQNLLK